MEFSDKNKVPRKKQIIFSVFTRVMLLIKFDGYMAWIRK